MILKYLILIVISACLSACTPDTIAIPQATKSQPALEARIAKKDSMTSASLRAAGYANERNQEGPAKSATAGAISVGLGWSGPSDPNDVKQVMAIADDILAGKSESAKSKIDKATEESTNNAADIGGLKKKVDFEHQQAAVQLQAKLDAAHNEARKARDRWVTAIFFGLGSILVVCGVVFLVLGSPFATIYYPALGPKAAIALIGSGVVLISLGIAVNAIESTLDRHPWAVGIGCGASIILVAISLALLYSNHHHATQKQ